MPDPNEEQAAQSSAEDASAMEALIQQRDNEVVEEEPEKEQQQPEPEPEPEQPEPEHQDEEPPKEEPKEEEPKEEQDDLDRIKPGPNAKPGTVKAVEALKKAAKEERKMRKERDELLIERDKKIAELEAKVLPPDKQERIDKLEEYYRNHEVENDPEFQSKYDQPIQRMENEAIELLKEWGLNAGVADFINEHGGLTDFQSSNMLVPAGAAHAVKEDGTPMTRSEWFHKVLVPILNEYQRDELKDHLAEARKLTRSRSVALKEAKSKGENWNKERQQATEAKNQEYMDRARNHALKLVEKFGDIAKAKDIPTGATSEERAEIESHNANVKKYADAAVRNMNPQTPEDRAEVAMNAALAQALQEKLGASGKTEKEQSKRIADLEKELDTIKKKGQTNKLRGAAPTTKATPKTSTMSDEEAMEAMMNP